MTSPVVLLDSLDSADAASLLADRLTVEGVGASALDEEVWVTIEDVENARVLQRLFLEVDLGISRVAPSYVSFWEGPRRRRVWGTIALASILLPALFYFFVASQL